MDKPFDNSMTVGKGWANWSLEDHGYQDGVYYGPEGVVTMYRQAGSDPHFSLRTAHKGRLYIRTYEREFSTRYSAKLARQFLKDIIL